MGNYQNINTLKPEGIENRKAYLVGGGISSLAAAAYLIRDGHMDGKNITILEETNIMGGCMDGSGNAKNGYIIRGGREMEEFYECCWDLYGKIPSLSNPERTVLDEFRELNIADPNESTCRLLHNCGEKADFSSLGLSDLHVKQLTKLILATEEELGATTVEEYFDPSFLETNMWCFWRSMFAFENWHSLVETRRYMLRFMHLLPGMNSLKNILFTKYNQYDSMILPLEKWLKSKNVVFDLHALVTDLDICIDENKKTVTAIHLLRNGKEEIIHITENDLVFVTNGSMTENSTLGNMHRPATLKRELGASWNLWKNIAGKDPSFGRPEVFCGDIDKTKWESFTITCTDSKIADILKDLTGRDPYSGKVVTGGIMTIKDSSWLLSVTCNRQPHFIDQPENVLVLWAYGLFPDNVGDFVKKRMCDCTGEELVTELLYHLGVKDELSEIIKTVNVIPCMMPYITSQFMPRVKGDRPDVIPAGSANLAFLGQFAEIADDCVFTVEYSIRSAITAVYGLLKLEKKVPEISPTKYDIRVLVAAARTLYSGRPLPGENILRKILKGTSLESLI
ncbi:MAG: oleate hydratase [Oligoflexales bacterium]|nr:oleate hydratase [Oligoflexales bacterium]